MQQWKPSIRLLLIVSALLVRGVTRIVDVPLGFDYRHTVVADPDLLSFGATPEAAADFWRRVHGAIGLVDLEAPPELLAAELGSLRIFAGYAGWGPGQLEKELSEGAWYVVESEPGDVSSPSPERLWRSVLRRQRSELAMVATYPDDASLN